MKKLQATILLMICLNTAQTRPLPHTSKHSRSLIVQDEYGRKIDAARQRGKVVFINFWSLSCVPCKEEMPTINNLREHYSNDTNFCILPVDLDGNFAEDRHFFKEQHITLTVYSPASAVPQTLFMGELPTTAVIDKTGKIALLRQGADKYDTPSFYRFIDSLLAI